MFYYSKKSQEAATMTWIFATFIIFFILLLYLALTGWIFVGKGANTAVTEHKELSKFSVTISLIDFLNSPAEKYGTVFDLIANSEVQDGAEDERRKLFRKLAEQYLSDNFNSAFYDYSISLNKENLDSPLNGYYYSYYDSSAAPESAGFSGGYSYLVSTNIPIIPDKKITLNVNRRK